MICRHCSSTVRLPLIDLGAAPPSNAYLTQEALDKPESWYPLRILVCERCWLAQTHDFADAAELFANDYAYFSGFSSTWVEHARAFVIQICTKLSLNSSSKVVEVASNDGYLLQHVKAKGIPCLGIEPTASTAAAARAKGIEVAEVFFGRQNARQLAQEGHAADLMVANNVLAHVPDINDFLAGFAILLKPSGVATFEFPHLLRLLDGLQFDTIYHEHFSYLSMLSADRIMRAAGLTPFRVEQLLTHGGSLRVYAQRSESKHHESDGSVQSLIAQEKQFGLDGATRYSGFQAHAERIRDDLMLYLVDSKRKGLSVAAYGAAAKGNTLLNFAGIRPDLVRFVVDRNPAKQGKYMPGSRIPIVGTEHLEAHRPDILLVLPWNIVDEVRAQNAHLAKLGTRFLVAIPQLHLT